MLFSPEERSVIVFVLNSAAVAIRDAPEVIPVGKEELLQLFSAAIDFARGSDDLLTLASLALKVDQILESPAFPSAQEIVVVLPGFGGGVVATTAMPTGVIAPERQTVRDALLFVKLNIEEAYAELRGEQATITLPGEMIAPFHYSFDGDRLTVNRQPAGVALGGTIASARAFLLEQGARLLADLMRSNSDRRLCEAFEALHQKISDGQDIVQLGLLNITLEGAIRGAEAEISGVLAGTLRGHTDVVRHYLAQFPEWVQFSDSAAELEVTREDLANLTTAVVTLAEALEKQAAVDEEVPGTLRSLANLHIDNPVKQRRAGLAIARTLASLALAVFRPTASFIGTTLARSLDDASKLIAKGLATIVAYTILHMGATFILSTDVAWLKPAAEIILRSDVVRHQ